MAASGNAHEGYKFPTDKVLTPTAGKRPVALIACGSFSPITHMHVRLYGTIVYWNLLRTE